MKIEVAGEDLQNMISKKSEFVTVIDSMKYIFIRWFLFYREKYGRVTVRVDYGKKENRNRPADDLTLSEFLAIYNDSDRYLVDTLPKEMWDEFFLPNCLLCGGFTTRLQVRNDQYHSLAMTLNWLITLFCGWLGMPTAWGMTGFFVSIVEC